jgi:hypothetical protein
MKKSINIEFETALEFIASYAKKDMQEEREELEKLCGMSYIEIVEKIHLHEDGELEEAFTKFARQVCFDYCPVHNIFHEYSECPICTLRSLDIDIEND